MRYAIWYHLYNLKNVKHPCMSVEPATLLKVTLLHGCFSRFLNCTNGTKSYKASHMFHEFLRLYLYLCPSKQKEGTTKKCENKNLS